MDNTENSMNNTEHNMDKKEHNMDNIENNMNNTEHNMDTTEKNMNIKLNNKSENKIDNKPEGKSKKKFVWRLVFFPAAIMYLEIIFHFLIYKEFDKNIIHPVLFAIATGMVITLVSSLFNKIANAIFGYFILTLFTAYYITQLIYYKIFDTFLSLVSVGGAKDAMNFKEFMMQTIRHNIVGVLMLLIPLVTLILLNIFLVSFERNNVKKMLILSGGGCFVLWTFAILMLNVNGRKIYSPYNLFHENYVLELSMNRLGVVVTTAKDALSMIKGNKKTKPKFELTKNNDNIDDKKDDNSGDISGKKVATDSDAKKDITKENKKSDKPELHIDKSIDFDKLYDKADSEELKNLTAYFSSKNATKTNEYTGIFKDYNVVFITAESLSKYGICQKCTPTLYKIMNEGFVFENYYNPRWYHSTIDGEYVNCLSQYPSETDWSFEKSGTTYQPYALGNILNKEGYSSFAYHDFDFRYYDRHITHPNMGYDFKAIDYGLDIPCYTTYSDLDTISAVYKEFINKDKFNMYFMTFSGHLPYNYEYNAMCVKNKDEAIKLTEGMNLSEEAICYIAAQMELDKALKLLMDELDAAGKLEKTVFVVAPDHFPYGLSAGVLDELAGDSIENDKFKLHKTCLGIWSPSMKKPVKVDKLCASVDILPTVLNLLGCDYDSRLLAGNDILSDEKPLVIFADRSFMTDRIKYDAATGKTTMLTDLFVDDAYVNDMIDEVENRLYISTCMIDTDYFGFVYGK